MKVFQLIAVLVSLGSAFGAGTVSQGVSQVGISDTWVISFTWTGDASNGSVPFTAATNVPNAIQGYWPFSVETTPGFPAPTSGYSVVVVDSSGADILGGAAIAASATAGQSWQVASSIPPLNGLLTLRITGNVVASAQGTVSIYLSKLKPRPGSGTAGAAGPPGAPGAISQIQDESINLPVQPNLNFLGAGVTCVDNGGTSATDCTIPAIGGVTSVGWTGGIVSVGTPTSTPAFTIAGTSGGLPCFNSGSTWISSALLATHGVMLGGGAGACPTALSALGTAGWVLTSNGAGVDPSFQPSSGGGGGNPQIQLDNVDIGSPRATIDFLTGTGLSTVIIDTGVKTTIQNTVDNGVVQYRSAAQSGVSNYCRSTTGNDTYACTMTPTLTAYTRGGCVVLDADTANTGVATIEVDALGAKSILLRTGALADGDIPADIPITVCYDGTAYRVQ